MGIQQCGGGIDIRSSTYGRHCVKTWQRRLHSRWKQLKRNKQRVGKTAAEAEVKAAEQLLAEAERVAPNAVQEAEEKRLAKEAAEDSVATRKLEAERLAAAAAEAAREAEVERLAVEEAQQKAAEEAVRG